MNEIAPVHIMLVEDDASLAQWFYDYLHENGYMITLVNRGDLAVDLITSEQPDLVVLDVMLPGKDGFDVCKAVRTSFNNPILMMTARDEETDEVLGLELGADDYLIKPVKPRVLLSRIKALLRRSVPLQTATGPSHLNFGKLVLDLTAQNVLLNNSRIALSSNEFHILSVLANAADNVVSRASLVEQYRGIEYDGFDRSIDIIISRLRKKLLDDSTNPFRIKTIWGKGYLFVSSAWGD